VRDRPHRYASVRRLEPVDAAERRGNADRARAVGALVQRTQARRDRGGGARARPAGGRGGVPRVARDAGQWAVAEGLPAELRTRRLAREDTGGLYRPG